MRNFKDMPSKNQFKPTWQEEQKKNPKEIGIFKRN